MTNKNKKLFFIVICIACVIALTINTSASQLSKEELTEKYGYLCDIYQNPDTSVYWAKEKIGDAAFMPYTGEITASGTENGYCYDVINNEFIRITGADYEQMDPNIEVLQIPDMILGMPVKEIGYQAFCRAGEHLVSLKEVVVPQSVEIIAERAFSRVFCGPKEVLEGMTTQEKKDSGYRINIPENVRFIGYRAYFCCAFAVCNNSGDDRVIHLPESLEYISAQAFDAEINSRLGETTIEVDMPESLVFMSSDSFWTNIYFGDLPVEITFVKYEDVFSDDIPKEYVPLMRSVLGKGFYNAKRNIITMQDVLRTFMEENGMVVPAVIARTHTYEAYTNEDTACFGKYHTRMDFWLDLASKNAPDLLPTIVSAGNTNHDAFNTSSEIHIAGDVNEDGTVDISDAVIVSRFCAGVSDIIISDTGLGYADVNYDGRVTLDDAITIVKQIVGT